MTFTIVTVAEMQFMAGENVDPTGDVTANHQFLHDMAAGYLSAFLQDDVIAGYSGYDSVTKQLINEWAARHAGMQLILFNTTGYSDLIEAEDMVQIHVYRMEKIEDILSKGEVKKQLKVNA